MMSLSKLSKRHCPIVEEDEENDFESGRNKKREIIQWILNFEENDKPVSS